MQFRRLHCRVRQHFCNLRYTSSLGPSYNPAGVESRWQARWQKEAAAMTVDNELGAGEDKFYMLSMFPYPSGRLHMGHVRVYTISDTVARFYRMRGKKVLHPMGWDAFGLPAENAAIERGIPPAQWTEDNVSHMRGQLQGLGCQFDWHREVYTCAPEYYRWTQWLFLQLYKRGLAYKKKSLVNWDPVDQTVLANEQVDESGHSWRSGARVEQRHLEQWFLRITDYAEPLLRGLDDLNWPSSVKLMQANWIGKSEGAFFDFKLQGVDCPPLRVFTTRPDTLFGTIFLAISPEHQLLENTLLFSSSVLQSVQDLKNNSQTPVITRDKKKEGIALGLHTIHPFTGAPIPVYAADYVISEYGTKAVIGVPAHDERDLQFAEEHGLPVVRVVEEEGGVLSNSEQFSGMPADEGSKAIVDHAHHLGVGGHMTQYKLRDWLISRQRYWGAPIPMLYCEKCGMVPVSEDNLPVLLPSDIQFTGRGPSPLTQARDWLRASCGRPGCCAMRETDTMDTFVDSSWYFLRFIDPHHTHRPFTGDANQWMPVDTYVGGIEHAILHLLYARFITHFLHDIGLLKVREPFTKLLTQGMVQGRTYRLQSSGRYLKPEEREGVAEGEGEEVEVTWEKMSKSKYNGVDPEDIVQEYGADTVRLFMLFKAPPEAAIQWDIKAIQGVHRWLKRVWVLCREHVEACRSQPVADTREDRSQPVADTQEDRSQPVADTQEDRSQPAADTQEDRSQPVADTREDGAADAERKKIVSATHKAIRQVTASLSEKHTFNVAVAELMTLSNALRDCQGSGAGMAASEEYHRALTTLCTLLAPMAPHVAAELWEGLKTASENLKLPVYKGSVLEQPWPSCIEELISEDSATVVIQVNGKKKAVVTMAAELIGEHKQLEAEALKVGQEMGIIKNHSVRKVIIATHGKVINFVTRTAA